MKALRIHEFGDPSQARIEETETHAPAAGELVVRVEAASVNPLDLQLMAGYMQAFMPFDFPYTPGTDIAGVVESTGPLVSRFKAGDRVFGRLDPTHGGGFAPFATLPANHVCAMPDALSFEQAAALPTGAGTAWLALFDMGGLQRGQWVCIQAAAGGVGSFAVQLAKRAGAYVVGTASSASHELVRNLGADEVIDYRKEDVTARLQDTDLVLHTVRAEPSERALSIIKPGGRLLSLTDPKVQGRDEVDAAFVFFQHDAATLDNIGALVASHDLQVLVDTIHPLDEARAALEQVGAGHVHGKAIITPSR